MKDVLQRLYDKGLCREYVKRMAKNHDIKLNMVYSNNDFINVLEDLQREIWSTGSVSTTSWSSTTI